MIVIHSPLKVILPRKRVKDKSFILNLNVYANTNYMILNEAKKKYKEVMKSKILALPFFETVEAVFVLYPKTKHLCDLSNVCSIQEKFFADALVELGRLEEDNYLFWKSSRYLFGSIDKNNPRVAIALREAKPRKLPII